MRYYYINALNDIILFRVNLEPKNADKPIIKMVAGPAEIERYSNSSEDKFKLKCNGDTELDFLILPGGIVEQGTNFSIETGPPLANGIAAESGVDLRGNPLSEEKAAEYCVDKQSRLLKD